MITPSTALYPSPTLFPERVIPNFTLEDDTILIPYKSVESSDSATLSESIAPFVFEPRFDSLSFADSINLNVTANLADSANVSEQISIAFEHIDSIAVTESIGPLTIAGPHDHIYVADSINVSLSSSDSTLFEEAVTIGTFIEDSITLSDFVNSIALRQSDEVAATDLVQSISTFVQSIDLDQTFIEFSAFIYADPPGKDHLHWNDEFDYQFIQTTLSSIDDPIVSEDIPNIEIPLIDSANVSEFISLSLVGIDSLSIVDALSSLTIAATSQDQFIYQELFDLSTDTNASDSSSITDNRNLEVNAIGNQPITFGEQVSITVSVADSGNLTEIIQNSLNNSDSLNFVENRRISLTQSESIVFSDLTLISANVNKSDASSLSESRNEIFLSSRQESFLLEIPFYNADYSRLDYIFLISEIASASILKEAFDYYYVTEATSNIILNALQLITFKERTGIGTAAPLVLNINDNPTIHSTVTGDIIDISIGGTEPVLL